MDTKQIDVADTQEVKTVTGFKNKKIYVIGAIAALDVTKVINLSVKGIIGLDRDSAENEKDPYMAVAPSATFTLAQRHQIGLGFQYESCDNNYAYNFPVYYKYSF